MGLFGGVSSFLLGDKAKPSQADSGLAYILSQSPEAQAIFQDVFKRGQEIGNQTEPFMPADFVALTPYQQQAIDKYGTYTPTPYAFDYGKKASAAFDTAGSTYAGAQPYYDEAANMYQSASAPITAEEIKGLYKQFYDPYMEDVISGVTNDIYRDREGNLAKARGLASQSQAFGGTRGALLESEIMRNSADILANRTGALRSQGYESAIGKALDTAKSNRSFAAAGGAGLSGVGAGKASLGGAQQSLASGLFGARTGMETIRNQEQQRTFDALQALLGAGTLQRGYGQEQSQYNRSVSQVPLQQIQFLQGLFSGFPQGSTQTGATQGTQGLLGSGGNLASTVGDFAKAALRAF